MKLKKSVRLMALLIAGVITTATPLQIMAAEDGGVVVPISEPVPEQINDTEPISNTPAASAPVASSTEQSADVTGEIQVEEDKNDDDVKIQSNDKPFLALGADLNPQQKTSVLDMMGIKEADLGNYDVLTVNNSEEHSYLDSYIDKSKIGTKSLSSVVIVEKEDGNGIKISTRNISYCTVGMYKNALATAGISNADIIVAAPFPISGTAALVGVFKAYKEMTGEDIPQNNVDAALHEIVITGELEQGSSSSADEIEGMIAYVKQQVVEGKLTDEASIQKVVDEASQKFSVSLSDEEKQQITELMTKIGGLDLDVKSLVNAAQSIYDKLNELSGDGGFFDKILYYLKLIVEKIKELF